MSRNMLRKLRTKLIIFVFLVLLVYVIFVVVLSVVLKAKKHCAKIYDFVCFVNVNLDIFLKNCEMRPVLSMTMTWALMILIKKIQMKKESSCFHHRNVLVLYATSSLGLRGFGYGVLLAAAATGNLIAAPLAPRVHDRLGSAGTIALAGVLAALAYPALAVTHSSVGAAAALLVETAAVLTGNVASRSLRQSFVPSSMQGRATAAFQTILLVSVPLGGLAGGVASAAVGIRDTFLAAGILQLLLVALLAPRLRSRLAGLKGAGPEGRHLGGPLPEGGVAAVRIA